MKIAFRFNRADLKTGLSNLLDLINTHSGCIDEVAVFTDMTEHCYEPLEDISYWSDEFSQMFAKLRENGVPSVGLNILNTIGQNDDSWDWLARSPYQTLVGHDGSTTTGSNCMRDIGFREYMKEKYRIYAKCDPDFIWVDDDMRIIYHGVQHPCFCYNCVETFNALHGTRFSREQLVAALKVGNPAELRRKWMEYNANEMCSILKDSCDAAREIKPDIKFGLMTTDVGWNLYSFANFKDMLDAIQGDWLRPGGGFWEASRPDAYYDKMISVAYQIFESRPLTDIQYESENIPHADSKPQRIHALEMTAALMSGCNGIAIDTVRPVEPDSLNRVMNTVCKHRDLWNKLTDRIEGMSLRGGACAYRKDAVAVIPTDDWFEESVNGCFTNEKGIFKAGFPFTADPDLADYFTLSDEMVDAYSDSELKEMFSKAVVVDGGAARRLAIRGLGELCGADVGKAFTNGIREKYFDSVCTRGGSQAQFRGRKPIYITEMLDGGTPLTAVYSTTNIFCGYGSFLYENSLGGRVLVLNYVAWSLYEQQERIDLLRNSIRWICKDQPALDLGKARHILPILRVNPDSTEFALLLTNAWLDDAENISVSVRGIFGKTLYAVDLDSGSTFEIPAVNCGGMCSFTLNSIKSWQSLIITSKPL